MLTESQMKDNMVAVPHFSRCRLIAASTVQLVVLLHCEFAHAQRRPVLFENAYVGHPQGWRSDISTQVELADDFSLLTAGDVYAFSWHGRFDFDPDESGNFRISIYRDVASNKLHLPQTIPHYRIDISNVAATRPSGLFPLRYDVVLPTPLHLDAGVYWLRVHGTTGSGHSVDAWRHDTLWTV